MKSTKEAAGIWYSNSKEKWIVTTRSNKQRVYIGSHQTYKGALKLKAKYEAQYAHEHPDYNLLAHDAIAWKNKAYETILKLSRSSNAVMRVKQ